jgi:hypothetical protein
MPNNSHENYLKVMRPFKKPSEASNISEIATAGAAAQAPRVDSVRYPRNQKGSYIQAFVIVIDPTLKGVALSYMLRVS